MLYIADAESRLRYHHFGEGEYAMAEMIIQQLLLETGAQGIDQDLVVVQPLGLEVRPTGRRRNRPRPTSATPRAPASPRRPARGSTWRTTTPPHRSCPSTTGPLRDLNGRAARRAPQRATRTGRIRVPRARSQP